MSYVVGLFFILGLVFFTPAFIAVVDMYTWYFLDHNLTGLHYDGSRPFVIMACIAFGMACMGIAVNAADVGKKYE